METIGSGAVTAPFTAVKDSDVIVVIGANPTENHPVAATYFKQAAKRGAELIVMDPRGTAMKRYASHMLQFKPGRRVVLNAMMHVIVEEKLYDQQYIQAHSEGFDKLKEHLKKFKPEDMEKSAASLPKRSAPLPASMPRPMLQSSSGAWACRSTPTAPTMPAA
jgi:formate dehydrogenase major subunit